MRKDTTQINTGGLGGFDEFSVPCKLPWTLNSTHRREFGYRVVLACCCVPVGGGLVHEGEYAVGTGHLVGGEALYVDAVDWVLNKREREREGLRCV